MGDSRHGDSPETRKKQSKKRRSISTGVEIKDDGNAFRKNKSPSGITFRPRIGRRFFSRPFMKEEHYFRRPGYSFRFHRYYKAVSSQYIDVKNNGEGRLKKLKDPPQSSISKKQDTKIKKESLFFTVSQDRKGVQRQGFPPSLTRLAARSQAIQQKRQDIEEVYRQDCETFGTVVKMLIDKDPTLEKPIQFSLRENLWEIGLRCVEAMQQFIQEYDVRNPCPSTSSFPGCEPSCRRSPA